jgi:hypothetical protein
MIFNRTQADVEKAILIRNDKVKKFSELSSDDIEALERGFITINTINRVEEKQAELYGFFVGSGYSCPEILNRSWRDGEFFKIEDLKRLIANNEILRKAFFDLTETPLQPKPNYHFETTNAIEKILYDLSENYQYMVSNFKRCGVYRCGA